MLYPMCILSSIGDYPAVSMESLVDDGNEDDYKDDPELTLSGPEAESWSEYVDKKVLKNHKAKYIQRQDNIWGKRSSVILKTGPTNT